MSVTEVTVPKLGLTIESVEIGTWLVRPGDEVRAGDALVEVNADKADVVVESPVTGTVAELLADEGDEVSLTTVIARITNDADDAPDVVGSPHVVDSPDVVDSPGALAMSDRPALFRAADLAPVGPPPATPRAPAPLGRVRSSPYARRLAAEAEIDVSALDGTGPGGRVIARDVNAERERAPVAGPPATPPAVDEITSCTWELLLPSPDLDRTAIHLACASAAARSLGLGWAAPIRLVVHDRDAAQHIVLTNWRDLSPDGLRRRVGADPTDQSLPADLVVHDLELLDLHTWTPESVPVRTVVLGASTMRVSLTGGTQPMLRQVHLVPVTLILSGRVGPQPLAAFRAALAAEVDGS